MFASITKPKLPRGYSYVLKTSVLEKSLVESGIDCSIELHDWLPQRIGSILECEHWPANDRFEYDRLYVRAGAVPAALRHDAFESLVDKVLPRFGIWARGILGLPPGSPARFASPCFRARFLPDTGLSLDHAP